MIGHELALRRRDELAGKLSRMGPMRSADAMPRSIGIRPSTRLSVHLWPAVAVLAGAACLSYNGDRQRR